VEQFPWEIMFKTGMHYDQSAISGAGIAYPSGAREFTPGF